MIRITDKTECSGCTACLAVCPHKAISMKPDALGFLYPETDPDKCTECGLCEVVCDFAVSSSQSASDIREIQVAAAKNKDSDVLRTSQSGGVFAALAKAVVSKGGVVYGAAFNPDFSVSHRRSDNLEGCVAFSGSKYVQSDMGDSFRNVRKDLEEGRSVLFSGTPCQVAGLASYIPERLRDNLVTVDFICHGVPAPDVWKDYVSYMGRKGNLESVCFRDKSCSGWKAHMESFRYDDGRKVFRETYKVMFYKNVMLRHSCSVCPYDLRNRRSDITIADFWGVEEILPEIDSNAGVSMVLPMSGKGQALICEASAGLELVHAAVSSEFVSRRNPNLLRPTSIHQERQMFEGMYPAKGFMYAARRWGDLGWRYKAWKLKVFIRKITGRK